MVTFGPGQVAGLAGLPLINHDLYPTFQVCALPDPRPQGARGPSTPNTNLNGLSDAAYILLYYIVWNFYTFRAFSLMPALPIK